MSFNLFIVPFQGDYIWIEPQTKREFDVAIGARVIAVEGRRIQVIDDDNKVRLNLYNKNKKEKKEVLLTCKVVLF